VESVQLLSHLGDERALVERDLALGRRRRARRRLRGILPHLMQSVCELEPECGSWMRVIAALAHADQPPPRSTQLSLWPEPKETPRSPRKGTGEIVTQDERIERALDLLEHLAPTRLPILLEGESGSGKEVIARAAHGMSRRHEAAWVAVNCGAIPAQLQESELFGHARGAFTGATLEKPGLFEAAHQGTLFLDEVGEMEPRAQVKLLRVLEGGELRRLGEVRTRRVDVRIIAATNADVNHAVETGRFRRDLLFRLGAVRITLPPLRERRGDILPLARFFMRRASSRQVHLTPGAQQALLAHPWPGNVRELKFILERAVTIWERTQLPAVTSEMLFLPDGELGFLQSVERAVEAEHPSMDEKIRIPEGYSLTSYLREIERQLIEDALDRAGGNRTLASRILGGLSRTTLIGKMKRLGLPRV